MAAQPGQRADCVSVDDPPVVIEADTITVLVSGLHPLCDFGYVCNLTLRDGAELSVALVGVSSTALIADPWDEERHRPAGDLQVLDLTTVRRVIVP